MTAGSSRADSNSKQPVDMTNRPERIEQINDEHEVNRISTRVGTGSPDK